MGQKYIMVQKLLKLEYHQNTWVIFWRTLKMPSFNLEIDFALTCSARYFIIDDPDTGQEPTFTKTEL